MKVSLDTVAKAYQHTPDPSRYHVKFQPSQSDIEKVLEAFRLFIVNSGPNLRNMIEVVKGGFYNFPIYEDYRLEDYVLVVELRAVIVCQLTQEKLTITYEEVDSHVDKTRNSVRQLSPHELATGLEREIRDSLLRRAQFLQEASQRLALAGQNF